MLDRLKGANLTEADARKKDEGKSDGGLPPFQPQPGGFGRRATPIAGAAPAMPVAEKSAEAKPQGGNPLPQFRKPEQRLEPANNGGPLLGDIPTRIADWLMRELKDGRGVHCETMLTVVGALAGFAAQIGRAHV